MAYVPWLHFTKCMRIWKKATRRVPFSELDKPFTGREMRKMNSEEKCCTTSASPTSF